MANRLLIFFCVVFALNVYAQERPGRLLGRVFEKTNPREPVPFANVVVKDKAGAIIKGTAADDNGNYNISPLNPGTYNIEVTAVGYAKATIAGILIKPNEATTLNIPLQEATEMLTEVTITWEKPLVDNKTVVTSEEIVNMAIRDVAAVAATAAGAFQAVEGGGISIRGGREDATTYFIDGVKVRGSLSLPQGAIAQQQVYTGGVPAQFGDAIGGVISTTTKGPSPVYYGEAEILSSSLFDPYHYNLFGFTAGGPLIKKKGKPIVGFLFSSEYEYQADPRPFYTKQYRVREDVLRDLQKTPVRPANLGQGVLYNSEFITMDDLEEIPARLNAARNDFRMQTNFNIKLNDNTGILMGVRLSSRWGKDPSFLNSLFNYEFYGESRNTDWAVFGRFQQTLGSNQGSSKLKNAFYQIQVDYQRNERRSFDPRFGDNIFAYGHIGYFDRFQDFFYTYGTDTATGLTGWLAIVPFDTAITFRPGPYNPIRARYTEIFYETVRQNPFLGNTRTYDALRQGRALWNGDNPQTVYNGLWGNVGAQIAGYSKGRFSQFRVTGSFSFEYERHQIITGFEFEQRVDRAFSVGANGLWTLMQQLQNDHIRELDFGSPMPVRDENGVFLDTIYYPRKFDAGKQNAFDERFRRRIGLDPNGLDFLNVFSYDPSIFSLDLFAADELINLSGSRLVSYYGYDHTGRISDRRVSINDFFTRRGADGRLLRPIGAFEPLYVAGYIQDQFEFYDLRFNVGVRVDYFDLNQPVLKDPYNLYPGVTVGEVRNGIFPNIRGDIPSNIGDNFAVYVDNYNYFIGGNEFSNVVGFRNGDNWYDVQGRRIDNPKLIADLGGGNVRPVLYDRPENQRLGPNSFTDYRPQVVVMPRISFNFPISDVALFYAHYDVLAQRPDVGLSRFNPIEYLELEFGKNLLDPINNPNLRPQRTTDYEIGFQQVLSARSVLKIASFYREMRDMMQTIALTQAYPNTYITYGNRDFGTVKGFTFEYDLRRTGNVSLTANYTLQFADGTGSGPNSGANLARSGQPNIRYILPLSFDTRHRIVTRLDYRYGKGVNYNGPVWFNKKVFENAGVNILVTANSGTPYSRRLFAYPINASETQSPLIGQVNGSRLPWQLRVDLRVNKIFDVKLNKDSKKSQQLDVYLQILNALNTRNVVAVYPYTGLPDDDGYLTSPQAINAINSQVSAQSYIDLYNVRLLSPFNFGLPRRIRLGIMFNF